MAKSEGRDSNTLAPKKESPILRELKDQGTLLGGTVGLLGVIHLVNAIGGGWLNGLGIIPRTLSGLKGILFAPFLHGSWGHLAANSVPLLILGWMVMLRRKRDFFYVSGISGLVAGVGTWIIGRNGDYDNVTHIGASGVVFGLIGYLISRAVMERKFWSILAAVATLFLYGGALFGIFPTSAGVSWEGHLFGLIGGIVASYYMLKNAKKTGDQPVVPAPRARVAAAVDDEAPKPRLQTSASRIQEEEFESESELEKELAALRRRKAANR
jgi:membrane associated rhomboid family serine protease